MKMIDRGFLNELYDLYDLEKYKEEIISMEGFGEKSYANLMRSIEASQNTTLPRFIYSLGILNVGLSTAKLLCSHFGGSFDKIREASAEEITEIDGIGAVIAGSIRDYFDNSHNEKVIAGLLGYLHFEEMEVTPESEQLLNGKTFVITGSVEHFKNRKELKEKIETLGGKVTGSVTGKTDYLINNDNLSGSTKNKKAKELGIPILTEDEFLVMINEGKR